MIKILFTVLAVVFCINAYAGPVRIVAAENFYGQVAERLGGPYVQVTSILKNPQQDPHLFSNSPETAKAIAQTDLIIYNGLGYDAWIKNLIAIAEGKNKLILNIGDLTGKTMGDNPHIWYDPKTMLIYATYLTTQLSQLDAPHTPYYHQQFRAFKKDHQILLQKIKSLKEKYQGTPVIATEPIFNYMAEALGLKMEAQGFQLSIMNGTEPRVSDIKNFENNLKNHTVKILFYNNQVENPATTRVKKLAEKYNIPVVGVSETQPPNQSYFMWMDNELNELENALERTRSLG